MVVVVNLGELAHEDINECCSQGAKSASNNAVTQFRFL